MARQFGVLGVAVDGDDVRGWTNAEIADELSISISTVTTHLASLMRKLNPRNRVEIAMWAHETGRIEP